MPRLPRGGPARTFAVSPRTPALPRTDNHRRERPPVRLQSGFRGIGLELADCGWGFCVDYYRLQLALGAG